MALPTLRHPSPQPQQPPLPFSTLAARDNNFHTGLGDPPHGHDPGAGAWGSKPKTAGMIAKKIAIVAAINQGVFDLYPGPNASRHMAHYLENTGMPLKVNLENMIQSVPSAQLLMVMKFRQAQTFVQTLPPGRHQFTSINAESGYDYKTESADWFFATGGYTLWAKGEVTITKGKYARHYAMEFAYCFYDRYNWDSGKSVTIGQWTITDEFMGEFHREGLAREFDCDGVIKRSLAWDGEFGAVDNSAILRRPGR